MADDPKQNIDPYDLILVTDNGQFFVVKMQEQNQGHEPIRIEPLNNAFKPVPEALRTMGIELADIPEHVNTGGCSCVLLNLQRIEGRGPSKDDALAKGAQIRAVIGGGPR
jgi:hypothetical protein